MMSFMLGVLGSLLFWAIYTLASFFITILIGKSSRFETFDLNDLQVIAFPEDREKDDLTVAMMGFIIIFIFWPFILFFCGMASILRLIGRLFLYLLSFCVRSVESKVPIIKVTFDKE